MGLDMYLTKRGKTSKEDEGRPVKKTKEEKSATGGKPTRFLTGSTTISKVSNSKNTPKKWRFLTVRE